MIDQTTSTSASNGIVNVSDMVKDDDNNIYIVGTVRNTVTLNNIKVLALKDDLSIKYEYEYN